MEIALIGDANTGKTTLLEKIGARLNEEGKYEVGFPTRYGPVRCKVVVGDEPLPAHATVIIYEGPSAKSFERALDKYRRSTGPKVLVANKSELRTYQHSPDDPTITFFPISAKLNQRCLEPFLSLVQPQRQL
ncbi:MAG: P-loop NTPase family protein [Nitrososphaerales archaeon]